MILKSLSAILPCLIGTVLAASTTRNPHGQVEEGARNPGLYGFEKEESKQSLPTTTGVSASQAPSSHQHRTLAALEWVQVGGVIDAPGRTISISRDGQRIAIGAPSPIPGLVRVYEWDGSHWSQMGNDIIGRTEDLSYHTNFGYSLSMSGDGLRFVAGAPRHSVQWDSGYGDYTDFGMWEEDSGYADVFDWNGTSWISTEVFWGDDGGDFVGESVHMSDNGRRIAVKSHGARRDEPQVEVYDLDGSNWKLIASHFESGAFTLAMSGNGERFGIGSRDGHATFYELKGSSFSKMGATINADAPHDGDGVGVDLSHTGDRVAVHAFGRPGFVRILDWNGSAWNQIGEDLKRGGSVSLSKNGQRFFFYDSRRDYALVYALDGSSWKPLSEELVGGTYSDADGDYVAARAHNNDDENKVRVFKLAGKPTSKFPDDFRMVTCDFRACLSKLIGKLNKRPTTFGDEILDEFVLNALSNATEAKRAIKRGGKVIESLKLLQRVMSYMARLKNRGSNLDKNDAVDLSQAIGEQGSSCAIAYVNNFISAYRDEGVLDKMSIESVETKLKAAQAKRKGGKWKKSVKRCISAIQKSMAMLEESSVPLCDD